MWVAFDFPDYEHGEEHAWWIISRGGIEMGD